MDLKKEHVRKDNTSCNFCDRGELNQSGFGLVYPYEYVYTFKRTNANGIKVSMCEDCLNELIELTNNGDNKINR
jgi:hypothetical protein